MCSCQCQPLGACGRLGGVGQSVGNGVGVLLGRTVGVLVDVSVAVGVAVGLIVFVIVHVAVAKTNDFSGFSDGVGSADDVGDGTAIITMLPEKIIYVSCNPAALARDVAMMSESYRIEEVQPVDLFPHTYHIESVALLTKKNTPQ